MADKGNDEIARLLKPFAEELAALDRKVAPPLPDNYVIGAGGVLTVGHLRALCGMAND